MNATIEKLYDTYGTSVLENTDYFPNQTIKNILYSLPIGDDARLDLLDQIDHAYLEWSTNAFAAGLHLGLTLLSEGVR